MKTKDINKYTGFKLDSITQIDRLDPSSISSKEFFDSYISKRKPCILTSIKLYEDHHPSHNKILMWKDLDYISYQSGNNLCTVESKQDNQFGSAKKRTETTCREFIQSLKSGSTNNYLTTQYTHSASESPLNDYCCAPLNQLTKDFPARPCLIPTLVPQQVNLWLGNSMDGCSSGLHHDFADNLYVLLLGVKRFTISSPGDALKMQTFGKIRGVFQNGLVQYMKSVRNDGAYIGDVLKYKLDQAELELSRLEREEGDNTERIQIAADRVEEIMEIMLDFEMDDKPCESVEACSFSKASAKEFQSKNSVYKDLDSVVRCTVDLKAGEMLYLPASWFHEVTSFSGEENVHMAMNYWFHPPTHDSFLAPYEDGFWESKWKDTEILLANLNSVNEKTNFNDEFESNRIESSKMIAPKQEDQNFTGHEVEYRHSGKWHIKKI